MEDEINEQEELAKIKEKKQELALVKSKDTSIMDLVRQQENDLMQTKEVQDLSRLYGEERIKADLKEEASRIRKKNIETAEKDFEAETRELRLHHLKAELEKEHKYNMETLEQDAKHSQILNARKKLVERYGYLYDNKEENLRTAIDGKGGEYKVPKDFSYSKFVNKVRAFGRNMSKLDKPILQTIKWVVIIGAIGLGLFLLKKFGIM